jgi:hypothetical protein
LRAANRAAELVPLKLGFQSRIEEVARVQVVVAMELVQAAVQFVGPDLEIALIWPPEFRPNSAL